MSLTAKKLKYCARNIRRRNCPWIVLKICDYGHIAVSLPRLSKKVVDTGVGINVYFASYIRKREFFTVTLLKRQHRPANNEQYLYVSRIDSSFLKKETRKTLMARKKRRVGKKQRVFSIFQATSHISEN